MNDEEFEVQWSEAALAELGLGQYVGASVEVDRQGRLLEQRIYILDEKNREYGKEAWEPRRWNHHVRTTLGPLARQAARDAGFLK